MTSKRERNDPQGDVRFVRRDASGRFAQSDDAGRSPRKDRQQPAKTVVQPGQGDRGDQRRH